jgi:hypothetical protein
VLADSTSYAFLASLLPFVILVGFWAFMMKNVRTRIPTQYQPVVDKLEEIRAELERLRRAVEERQPEEERFGFRS